MVAMPGVIVYVCMHTRHCVPGLASYKSMQIPCKCDAGMKMHHKSRAERRLRFSAGPDAESRVLGYPLLKLTQADVEVATQGPDSTSLHDLVKPIIHRTSDDPSIVQIYPWAAHRPTVWRNPQTLTPHPEAPNLPQAPSKSPIACWSLHGPVGEPPPQCYGYVCELALGF